MEEQYHESSVASQWMWGEPPPPQRFPQNPDASSYYMCSSRVDEGISEEESRASSLVELNRIVERISPHQHPSPHMTGSAHREGFHRGTVDQFSSKMIPQQDSMSDTAYETLYGSDNSVENGVFSATNSAEIDKRLEEGCGRRFNHGLKASKSFSEIRDSGYIDTKNCVSDMVNFKSVANHNNNINSAQYHNVNYRNQPVNSLSNDLIQSDRVQLSKDNSSLEFVKTDSRRCRSISPVLLNSDISSNCDENSNSANCIRRVLSLNFDIIKPNGGREPKNSNLEFSSCYSKDSTMLNVGECVRSFEVPLNNDGNQVLLRHDDRNAEISAQSRWPSGDMMMMGEHGERSSLKINSGENYDENESNSEWLGEGMDEKCHKISGNFNRLDFDSLGRDGSEMSRDSMGYGGLMGHNDVELHMMKGFRAPQPPSSYQNILSSPPSTPSQPLPVAVEDDEGRTYFCTQCSYRARKKGQVRKHMSVHGLFVCAHCEHSSPSAEGLESHRKTAHPGLCGRRLCKRCRVLYAGSELEEHERMCAGEKPRWPCAACGKEFKFLSVMKAHVRKWHPRMSLDDSGDDDSVTSARSGSIIVNGHTHQGLSDSASRELTPVDSSPGAGRPGSVDNLVPRDMLRMNDNSLRSLDQDMSPSIMPMYAQDPTGLNNPSLPPVQYGGPMLESLNTNRPMNNARPPGPASLSSDPALGRPFRCEQCQKSFKTKWTLANHAMQHHCADSPFTCDHCPPGAGAAFRSDKELNVHRERVHALGPRRYPCPHESCTMQFAKYGHFKRHLQTHAVPAAPEGPEGERKYKCDWVDCGKTFSHTDNLKVHYRRHTDEKPFPCHRCSAAYRQKSGLKYHLEKVHDERSSSRMGRRRKESPGLSQLASGPHLLQYNTVGPPQPRGPHVMESEISIHCQSDNHSSRSTPVSGGWVPHSGVGPAGSGLVDQRPDLMLRTNEQWLGPGKAPPIRDYPGRGFPRDHVPGGEEQERKREGGDNMFINNGSIKRHRTYEDYVDYGMEREEELRFKLNDHVMADQQDSRNQWSREGAMFTSSNPSIIPSKQLMPSNNTQQDLMYQPGTLDHRGMGYPQQLAGERNAGDDLAFDSDGIAQHTGFSYSNQDSASSRSHTGLIKEDIDFVEIGGGAMGLESFKRRDLDSANSFQMQEMNGGGGGMSGGSGGGMSLDGRTDSQNSDRTLTSPGVYNNNNNNGSGYRGVDQMLREGGGREEVQGYGGRMNHSEARQFEGEYPVDGEYRMNAQGFCGPGSLGGVSSASVGSRSAHGSADGSRGSLEYHARAGEPGGMTAPHWQTLERLSHVGEGLAEGGLTPGGGAMREGGGVVREGGGVVREEVEQRLLSERYQTEKDQTHQSPNTATDEYRRFMDRPVSPRWQQQQQQQQQDHEEVWRETRPDRVPPSWQNLPPQEGWGAEPNPSDFESLHRKQNFGSNFAQNSVWRQGEGGVREQGVSFPSANLTDSVMRYHQQQQQQQQQSYQRLPGFSNGLTPNPDVYAAQPGSNPHYPAGGMSGYTTFDHQDSNTYPFYHPGLQNTTGSREIFPPQGALGRQPELARGSSYRVGYERGGVMRGEAGGMWQGGGREFYPPDVRNQAAYQNSMSYTNMLPRYY